MSKKPVLVIMAAGMGSRYGGLKQIDPVDKEGHIIMDFSIYDAKRAGFEKVIFIIKKANEKDFKESIGEGIYGAYVDNIIILPDKVCDNLPFIETNFLANINNKMSYEEANDFQLY